MGCMRGFWPEAYAEPDVLCLTIVHQMKAQQLFHSTRREILVGNLSSKGEKTSVK